MDRWSFDALRGRVGLLAPVTPSVPADDEEERHPSVLPKAPTDRSEPVCPTEVEARLAVLLRWM